MAANNRGETVARRGKGKPFEPGQSGNPSGRPKGMPNNATVEIKEFALTLTTRDPEWLESARQRMKDGKAPHLETYLLQMAYGKPKETIEHSGRTSMAEILCAAIQRADEASEAEA
jgi:hypothetical protein